MDVRAQIPTAGLVAQYELNGNAVDNTSNSNNGTITGSVTATTDRFGNCNSAMQFGGSSNVGYISIPSSSSLNFTNSQTISVWLKLSSFAGMDGNGNPSATNGNHCIIGKAGDGISVPPGFFINLANSSGNLQAGYGVTPANNNVSTTYPSYPIDTWFHLAVVASSTQLKIYIDGVLKNTATTTVDLSSSNTQRLTLGIMGGHAAPTWYPFNGALDNLFLYNRSLTDAEVTQLFNQTGAPLTAPIVGTITQPTCATPTGSVVLSGLPATGTWTLTETPGGATTTGTGVSRTLTGLAEGTYTYTVTNAAGCVSPASTNVVINPAPVRPVAPTIGALTQPTCTLSTGSVEVSGLPPTWLLIRQPGSVSTSGTGATTTITGIPSGTYTYIAESAPGCQSPPSTSFTINPAPTTPTAPSVGTITQPTCAAPTSSVALSGLPATGTWTLTRLPDNVTVTGTGTSATVTNLPTGTYTYTVTNAAMCISLASTNIVINPATSAPTAPSVGTIVQPTCTLATGSVTLTDLPATGLWTLTPSPTGAPILGSGTTKPIFDLTPGTYTFTVTNAAGCTSPVSANVVINPQPSIPTAPSVGALVQPTCTLATGGVTLTGLPATGSWTLTPSPSGAPTTGTGASTTLSGLTSGTYTFTVTNATGCLSVASANVVINAQPTTPTAPTAGSITQPTCNLVTASVVFNGLPTTGAWTITRTPSSVTATGSGASGTVSGVPVGTFTFTVTNAAGCISPASANVVVNPVPNGPVINSVTATVTKLCGTQSSTILTVNGTLNSATSWQWYDRDCGIGSVGAGRQLDVSPDVTTTYYVRAEGGSCEPSSCGEIMITVTPIPTAPIVGTVTQPTCSSSAGAVVLSGLPATGTWTLTPNIGTPTTGTGTTKTITGLSPGTYTFAVTNFNGCKSPISTSFNISGSSGVPPTAPIVGAINQPTCLSPLSSVALSGLPSTGTWTLTRNPGNVMTTGTGTTTTITGLVGGTFTFVVTNEVGCSSPVSSNVVINSSGASFSPVISTVTQPTCSVAIGSVLLTGLPSSGQWTINPGAITGVGTTKLVSPLSPGDYNFTVTNQQGCISLPSATVMIDEAVNPPAPIVNVQVNCATGVFSVGFTGLPPVGTWTLQRSDFIRITGTGTSTTLQSLPQGTYFFVVINSVGCNSGATPNIVVPATTTPQNVQAPVIASIIQPNCSTSTGSVTFEGLPASGTWTLTRNPDNVSTTGTGFSTTLTGVPPGTYTYIVANALGCKSPATTSVVVNAALASATTPTVGTITQPTCATPTASFTLSGLPATGTWTLTRNPGAVITTGTGTSTNITGLPLGTYTYTVTNSSGCTSTPTASITINAVAGIPSTPIVTTVTQPTCAAPTGSVLISGLPSTGTWTLTRNPGSITTTGTGTSTTILGLTIGSHTVVVTNAAGCTSLASANIVVNAAPSAPSAPSVGTVTQPTCSVSTGSVALSGLPATGTWTLTRSPGSVPTTGTGTSTTVTGLPSGTYTFTVTNAAGCTSTASINVVINTATGAPTAPSVGTPTQPTCATPTGSVVLSGLPSTGTWTLTRNPGAVILTGTGATTTITGLTGGTYTYTVTIGGCASLPTANIIINAAPSAPTAPSVGTITQPTCSVSTGSVALSGLPSTGTWTLTRNPGAVPTTGTGTSTTVSGLPSGTFTFTVTNVDGCISTASVNIVINAAAGAPTTPSVGTVTQPTCTVLTGSVVLSGLPSTGTWTLTRNPGAITITGTGPMTTITGLTGGTYTYTVSLGSCTSSPTANIIVNLGLGTPTVPTVGTVTQPTCAISTGSVALSGLPSTGTWTLTRNPGGVATTGTGTTTTVSGLPVGTFTFTVTNASNCISSATTNITINGVTGAPTAPSVGTITQPTCALSTGSVVLSGLPSTGTWTLTRSPDGATTTGTGATTTINGLAIGSFTYTVTNAAGCQSLPSTNIIIDAVSGTPTAPSVGTITQPTCAIPTGSVVLNGLPSTGTWTLTRIGGPSITGTGVTTNVTGLVVGTYTFTVTNAAGCTSPISINIVINAIVGAPTAPSVGTVTQPTCSAPTGSVILSGLPSTGTWTLTRNPGSVTTTGTGTSTTVLGLPAGTFTYTVTNAEGCISVASLNVMVNVATGAPTAPSVGTLTQPTCSTTSNSLILTGLPTTGTWTLTRSPDNVTTTGTGVSTTFSNLAANTYTFTVTNSAGCVSSPSINIVINAAPTTPSAPSIGTVTQATCLAPSGSLVLNGLPATGTWTLTRSPSGATTTGIGVTTTLTGVPFGSHTFTVTNAAGCTSSVSASVVFDAVAGLPTAPSVGALTQPSCTVLTGSVVLSGLPTTGTWTLTRNPSGTTSTGTGVSTTITGLAGGTYTYTVTNAAGCTSPASANIVINATNGPPTAPSVGALTQPTCTVSTGGVVLSGLPATGTWTLTRSPNSVTSTGTGVSTTITGLAAGTYTYTVTNAATCVSSASANIVINAPLTTPAKPLIGTVTQSICDTATGTIVLNGLPATGTWRIEPTGKTGTGGSTTLTKLAKGKYNFAVVNDKGCTSLPATVELGCGSADEPCLGELSNVIPDGFTPGGGGTNDFFDPQKYISVAGCSKKIEASELHIINRWGETIYKSVPYIQWDGKSGTNQRTVPTGAYYYVLVLNADGVRRTVKGLIHLFSD